MHRGEFVQRGAVRIGVMEREINTFIGKVRPYLPELPLAPVPKSAPESLVPPALPPGPEQ